MFSFLKNRSYCLRLSVAAFVVMEKQEWRNNVEINLDMNHLEISASELVSAEAAVRGVLYEKVILKISQDSQENICATISFLIKLQA